MANELYRIYSSLDPVIKSGETAEINVSQILTQGATALLHATGPTVKVAVQGPQTSLTEDDISGVYPAAGSTDSPDDYLPHIALTRRTLPWERRGPADGAPWLALLVITQSDLNMSVTDTVTGTVTGTGGLVEKAPTAVLTPTPPSPPPVLKPAVERAVPVAREVTPATNIEAVASVSDIASKVAIQRTVSAGPITPRSIAVKDLATSDAATHTQLLTIPGITDATSIQAIAIPAATLKLILPAAADLKLLCHVKEVVEDNVSTFISIVVSGRLPDAGDLTTTAPATHAALLVSLEHRDDIYTRLDKGGAINLIVLHSWTFVPSKGGDFREVCQMIGYHPNGGVLRFGNIPAAAANAAQALSGGFGNLLDNAGYMVTPLDHADPGNVIWRGPLRPFPPPPRSNGFAVRADAEEFAGAAPGAQLDYSHATAFELGKLLALADVGIREDLRDIHQVFNIPTNFVAMSNLPPALQKPYWGIDEGQTLQQSEALFDQGMQQPWSFANNQSMVGIQNAVGGGEVAGFSAAAAQAWQASITTVIGAVQAPVATGTVSQIDIGAVTEAGLATQFPGLVNAAIAGGE
jgi:hypothetical protein